MRYGVLILAVLIAFTAVPVFCFAANEKPMAQEDETGTPFVEEIAVETITPEGVEVDLIEADGYIEAAKQSFAKKELTKAGEEIKKASEAVERASKKAGVATKTGLVKSAAGLKKLSVDVEKGMVKSGQELKQKINRSYHHVAHPKKKEAVQS